jgi:hypothetical protein
MLPALSLSSSAERKRKSSGPEHPYGKPWPHFTGGMRGSAPGTRLHFRLLSQLLHFVLFLLLGFPSFPFQPLLPLFNLFIRPLFALLQLLFYPLVHSVFNRLSAGRTTGQTDESGCEQGKDLLPHVPLSQVVGAQPRASPAVVSVPRLPSIFSATFLSYPDVWLFTGGIAKFLVKRLALGCSLPSEFVEIGQGHPFARL